MNRIFLALVLFPLPIALMIFGLRTLFLSIFAIHLGYSAIDWPKAPSRMTESTVVDGFGKYGNSCKAKVEYEFTIEGIRYSGNTLIAGQPPKPRSVVEAVVAKYPVGATVNVFYNPKSPETSVIQAGVGEAIPMFTLIGLLFLSVGAYGLHLCYRKWRTTNG